MFVVEIFFAFPKSDLINNMVTSDVIIGHWISLKYISRVLISRFSTDLRDVSNVHGQRFQYDICEKGSPYHGRFNPIMPVPTTGNLLIDKNKNTFHKDL